MTIFNKTCTFNVGNDALLMTKVTSLRLCLCQCCNTPFCCIPTQSAADYFLYKIVYI